MINAVGKDRTDMIQGMTTYLRGVNGTIRGSPGVRLGQHFYELSMLADVPRNQVQNLMDEMKTNGATRDLHATVYEASLNAIDDIDSPSKSHHQVVGYSCNITLEGVNTADAGTMQKIASTLKRHGLDLQHMDYSLTFPPKIVGIAHAYEPLPLGFNPSKISRELERLGTTLNCRMSMTETYRVDNDDAWEDDEDFLHDIDIAA